MKGNANERGAAFMAIGKLAQAVGSAIAPQLGSIVAQIEGEYSSVCVVHCLPLRTCCANPAHNLI